MKRRSTRAWLCGLLGFCGACFCQDGACGVGQRPTVGSDCDPTALHGLCPIGGQIGLGPGHDPSGLICSRGPGDGGFTCQMPSELEPCTLETGCLAPLGCDVTYGLCLQGPCSESADCADPLTTCQTLSAADGTGAIDGVSCWPTSCGALWQPCAAAGGDGGGTCVPFPTQPWGQPPLSDGLPAVGMPGTCLQAGSMPAGGTCQYLRGPGPGLCAPGLICMLDTAGDGQGICLPLCDGAAKGGPSCGANQRCVPTAAPPPNVGLYARLGGCAQACSTADAGVESGTAGCQAPTRCVTITAGGLLENVCLP